MSTFRQEFHQSLNILLGLSTSGRNSDILFQLKRANFDNNFQSLMELLQAGGLKNVKCASSMRISPTITYCQNENVLIDKDVYDIA